MNLAGRIDRARRGELSSRPTLASITIGYPLTGEGATLRLFTAGGAVCSSYVARLTERGPAGRPNDPAGTFLGELSEGAMTPGLLSAAGWHLYRYGFNYAPGAQWTEAVMSNAEKATRAEWSTSMRTPAPYVSKVAIVPTPAYLSYVDRMYGPVPDLTGQLPDGVTAAPTSRGWWDVTTPTGSYVLTWSPGMAGDRWRMWKGARRSELAATGDSPAELFARLDSRP
ncbi:hypothetical protein ACFWXO_30980 [Kitasatospora sp. NPDC059088]|uniref:hypothetical protein n=1 Tax=Kitasatospora sp. NPDC059088 TaxID=3346722 RepID=UPI00368F2DC5